MRIVGKKFPKYSDNGQEKLLNMLSVEKDPLDQILINISLSITLRNDLKKFPNIMTIKE